MDANTSNEQVKTAQAYDEVPYYSSAFPEVHPNRFAVIAYLFGMSPTPINQCRVLELGCGSAASLIATASNLPNSEFIGVDLAANEVNLANKQIETLGLKNIEVKHFNIMDIDKSFGSFDYILAPGVYSWVPKEVREKVLSICNELLAPNGVAYINYNLLPGWHMYQSLRDIMLYRTRKLKNSADIVKESRQFAEQLLQDNVIEDKPFAFFLNQEKEEMDSWTDGHLRHDLLGDINNQFYFHQFMDAAHAHHLQYLGEAPFQTMIVGNFPNAAQNILKEFGTDILEIEQYMDFLRYRQFRETLLCHDNIHLTRSISLEKLRSLYFVAQINPISSVPNIFSHDNEEFIAFDSTTINTTHPIAKALWMYLSGISPKPVSFKEILTNVQEELGKGNFIIQEFEEKAKGETILLANLLQGFSQGFLQLFMQPITITVEVSQHPKTTALIRYEAKKQLWVTNLLHQMVKIDTFAHHILPRLDGKNSIDDVLGLLVTDVKDGSIKLDRGGQPITDEAMIKNILLKQLMDVLRDSAKKGLLIE